MNKFNQVAFGIAVGFVACLVFVQTPEKPAESAPVVVPAVTQDAKPEPATGVSTEGPSDSGVEQPQPPVAVPPKSVSKTSLKDAIAEYRASYGVKYFVWGKTDQQHLIDDHGWKADQIRGLSLDEMQYLHGASHTGKINPQAFRADATPAEIGVHCPSARPAVRIISPATWDCPHCRTMLAYDWSDFDMKPEKRDGLSSYPCAEWTDSRGVTRRLYGKRTPQQVLWSYKKTCE